MVEARNPQLGDKVQLIEPLIRRGKEKYPVGTVFTVDIKTSDQIGVFIKAFDENRNKVYLRSSDKFEITDVSQRRSEYVTKPRTSRNHSYRTLTGGIMAACYAKREGRKTDLYIRNLDGTLEIFPENWWTIAYHLIKYSKDIGFGVIQRIIPLPNRLPTYLSVTDWVSRKSVIGQFENVKTFDIVKNQKTVIYTYEEEPDLLLDIRFGKSII